MNYSRIVKAFIGWVFVSAAMSGTARGATFTNVDNGYCKLALDGPVEAGDFQRLQSAIEIARHGVKTPAGLSACLNSLGGNYDEGLRMARLLLEQGVGTVVLPHRQCYSACAIMFMFGSFVGTDGARWPSRRLATEAALGFHAPYLKRGDAHEHDATHSVNFEQGVRAIGKFLTALYQTKDSNSGGYIDRDSLDAFFAPELVAAMISKGPDEAFMIQTLNDAGMWGIDVIASNSSAALNEQNIFQACTNAFSWRIHEPSNVVTPTEMMSWSRYKPVVRRHGNKTLAVLAGFIELTGEACVIEQFPLSDGQIHTDVRLVSGDDTATKFDVDVPWNQEEIAWAGGHDQSWYLLPPTNVICPERCATIREIPND